MHMKAPGDALFPPATRRAVLAWSLSGAGALMAPAAARAAAVSLEGARFEDRVHLFGSDLVLNGAGLRAVAWFKAFAAALYLSRPVSTGEAVVGLPGPKRLRLHMLWEVPAKEFTKALEGGISKNTTPAEWQRLQDRMQQFERLIEGVARVRRGDVVDLDFDPSRGMAFSLNGKLQGSAIAGADFYAALLRSFVGDVPFDRTLRAGLLGAPT